MKTRRRSRFERELRRHILMLWQTALIRLSRLKIQDEIETGLRYYPAAFFEVVPKVNAEVRDALRARWPDTELLTSRSCGPARGSAGIATAIRMSPPTWSGGDGQRLLRRTGPLLRRDHRAEEELSMSARLVKISDGLVTLADQCHGPPAPTSRIAGRCGSSTRG